MSYSITRISVRSTLLASACLCASTAAFAQDPAEGEAPIDSEETGNAIVVTATPIQDSLEAAIKQKRESLNVVEVVSADTIGRFPDQNLADSLGRIPGLAIERDQGQARFINLRGAPFRFTSIAFNGIDVPGAEDGRIPRFDSFPAAITRGIVVNKAITADMPGEAVSGYIDIQTASPFERDDFFFSVEAGLGNQELGDQRTERLNGTIGYSNDTFGILAFGSRNLRGRITDNREYELTVGPNGEIFPDNLDFRSYRGEREDRAYGGEIEIRPSMGTRIYARTIYSEFIDREERNQFDFDIADGAADTGTPFTATTGYQPEVEVTRLLEDGVYNNSTWTSTLGAEVESDDWTFSGSVSYIETTNDTSLPIPFSAAGSAAVQYDVSDILNPQVFLFEPGTMNPITADDITYPVTFGLIFGSALDTENYKIKVDIQREGLDFLQGDTTIKFGGQIDIREAEGGDTLVFGGFPDSVDISSFLTDDLWSSGFDNTIEARDFDNQGLIDAWESAVGGFDFPFDDDSLIFIDENIYAAYASFETRYDWGSFVFGARLEATDFETTGSEIGPDGSLTPLTVENDYVHLLPNAHVNIDLSDDIVLRLSASTGVSRPTYSQLRASISVDPTEVPATANGGNPRLDAEYSYGPDVSLEFYFADGMIFSVGAFGRWIDNVLYNAGTVVDDGSVIAPGLIPPGTPTQLNTTFNGEDGRLLGLEFNFVGQATFLPGALDGLGATANLTLLDSQFTAPNLGGQEFRLPGTSDVIFNASIFYEKFGFSARVNYQYRDDWLSTTENENLNEFWATTERVDASVRYNVPEFITGLGVTLFADANNITDVRDLRFTETKATPNQFEGFGERYMFGIRFDY
ncbi:MAG: TonB-dependent receptor [Pseudomonadota bacterium]